ncbi:hypothetical protein ACW95P_03935 [Candidatus Mycoplasma pogonae]
MIKELLLGVGAVSTLAVPSPSQVTPNEMYTEKDKIDFLKTIDFIASFSYSEINEALNLPLFKNEKIKIIFFNEFKKNNKTYNQFKKEVGNLLSSKSRRKKRALFEPEQRIKLKKC